MVDERNEMSPGLISGRLEGLSFPDLMWALCRRQAQGVLRLTRGTVCKSVYFEAGRAVFASSSDPDDRLGELLLREEAIRLQDLDEALQQLGRGKRIGTLLVEAGHLTPDALVHGVLQQVRNIVLDLFAWDDGEYDFEVGPLPTDEVITLNMPIGEIMFQGIRQIRSFSRIRRSVGVPRTCYRVIPEATDRVAEAEMTAGEEQLFARVQRGGASIEDLCREVFMSNFEVYQALWAFKVLGMIEETESSGTTVGDATLAGSFGPEGIAPLLVRLCRTGETGVLFVGRGSRERTIHLKDGRCVFATSNDIDDGLVLYLLRRGVISLRDREETAKRLLSNKRVGTILREMGVLDDLDLRNMVREHLSEIIHDTIGWHEGEYAFVAGELPTVEEITLDVPIEELISTALRRVTSWSRVRDGLGGLDAPLALTPEFLAVLDRMNIGPAEWDVVTALKKPRPATDAARDSDLGDFRVCQILWTLHVLGAVAPARDDATDDEVVIETQPEPVMAVAPPETLEEQAETDDRAWGDPWDEPEPQEVAEAEITAAPEDDFVVVAPPEAVEPDAVATSFEVSHVSESEPVAAWHEALEEPDPVESDEPRFRIDERAKRGEHPVGSGSGLLIDGGGLDSVETVASPLPPDLASFEIDIERPDDESFQDDGYADESPTWAGDDVEAVETEAFEEIDEDSDEVSRDAVRDDLDSTRAFTREEIVAALRAGELAAGKDDADVIVEEPEDRIEVPIEAFVEDDPSEDRTEEIPRDEIEAAIEGHGGNGDATEEVAEDVHLSFEPSGDLEGQISRFNARQRVLYRTIRAEVGAGAVNFVRSCCGRVTGDAVDPFVGADMRPDGTWDVDGLRRAAIDQRIAEPGRGYEQLIETEIEMLRIHIGEARTRALKAQIDRLESANPSA